MTAVKGKDRIVLIENGAIANENAKEIPDDAEIFDFSGDFVLPAFIELHAHGGGGYDFIDGTDESFEKIFETHLSHGVATLCPTLCACDFDQTLKFLGFCKSVSHEGFAGVHLEGPFLSKKMCGAQNLSYIVEPTDGVIKLLEDYSDVIARITAAPEIPGVLKLAGRLAGHKVSFSIGHSDCDAKLAREAVESGFSSVTHLFCSTPGRHKERSFVVGGLIEEALINDSLFVELIGDGHHVCRESLILTEKCKSAEKIAIVSDAMRAAGTGKSNLAVDDKITESYLGAKLPGNRVIIEGGVAKLPDRSSFAGSLAVGDTMVKALCGEYRLPLAKVSEMMSRTPAKILGLSDRGEIKKGLRADLTILDRGYSTKAVFRAGKPVYRRKDSECSD